MLVELNAEQLAAAQHGDGPLLIVAGAGTGKTATLAHRVAYLIERGADPRRILLLTFTRRAAAEMLRRVEAVLAARGHGTGGASERVWGGTFHAVAARLLRIHARDIGMEPDFTIMDRGDSEDLMHVARTRLGLGRGGSRFPQKSTCLDIYSRCVNAQLPLAEVLHTAFPWCLPAEDDLAQLFAAYTDAKEEQQVLDYDDLLLFWRGLLADPAGGARVRERFDHVLVDEYQDTNALQADIVSLLRPDGTGVTCVGDDAQAIYGFRAATVRNILDFEQRFPGARRRHAHAQLPLHGADPRRHQRDHRRGRRAARQGALDGPGRRRPPGPRHLPRRGRADAVALRAHPRAPRAGHAAQAAGRAVPRAAPLHGARDGALAPQHPLPQVRRAALRRDGARQGPRELPAPRREPQGRDGRPARARPGAGHRAQDRGGAAREPGRRRRRLPAAWAGARVPEPARAAWPAVVALFATLAAAGPSDVPAQVHAVRSVYAPLLERRYDNVQARLRDLEQIEGLAARSQTRSQFLAELVLDPPSYTQELAGPPLLDEDYLILSTMHSAKGLEFDVVYVIHAADGNIPSDMATGSADEIEEERRLFYVACTRAREQLYVSHPLRYYTQPWAKADTHGYAQRSRFLTRRRAAHFEEIQTGPERAAARRGPARARHHRVHPRRRALALGGAGRD